MENKENQCLFQYDTLKINVNKLKSSTELKEYLTEWGADYSALNDFCEEYQEKHGNQLYWHYPHSDDKHNGLYFVMCSDGVLCLPYDQMDTEYFEYFELEDARLLEPESIEYFIKDWVRFSADLVNAMKAMQIWMSKKE